MNDIQHAATLLYILHKTVNLPKLKALHDAAEAELIEMAADHGKVPDDEDLVRTASAPENTEPSVRPNHENDAPIFPDTSGVMERKI